MSRWIQLFLGIQSLRPGGSSWWLARWVSLWRWSWSTSSWLCFCIMQKNALLSVLMEAGGCAKWAEGHPSPDPFYVDQVKATLRQMAILDVFSVCETRSVGSICAFHACTDLHGFWWTTILNRLQGPAVPSLAKADWFLPLGKEKESKSGEPSAIVSLVRGQSSPKTLPPTPVKRTPESILKKKPLPSPSLPSQYLLISPHVQSIKHIHIVFLTALFERFHFNMV